MNVGRLEGGFKPVVIRLDTQEEVDRVYYAIRTRNCKPGTVSHPSMMLRDRLEHYITPQEEDDLEEEEEGI